MKIEKGMTTAMNRLELILAVYLKPEAANALIDVDGTLCHSLFSSFFYALLLNSHQLFLLVQK